MVITQMVVKNAYMEVSEDTVSGKKYYTLSWNDGVANAWNEQYDSLPIALTRMATLTECVLTDRCFTFADEDLFAGVAIEFIEGQVESIERQVG